jgi:hypothetical protein
MLFTFLIDILQRPFDAIKNNRMSGSVSCESFSFDGRDTSSLIPNGSIRGRYGDIISCMVSDTHNDFSTLI